MFALRSSRNLVKRRSIGFLAHDDFPCKTIPEIRYLIRAAERRQMSQIYTTASQQASSTQGLSVIAAKSHECRWAFRRAGRGHAPLSWLAIGMEQRAALVEGDGGWRYLGRSCEWQRGHGPCRGRRRRRGRGRRVRAPAAPPTTPSPRSGTQLRMLRRENGTNHAWAPPLWNKASG
jgi:hypothetical protein